MKNRKQAILNMKEILLKRREALRRALAGDLSLLRELDSRSGGDVVDFALDSVQDEITSQLIEVESRELARIEKALEKMQAGTYGVCEECGADIPLTRLYALPYATLCIRCQRELERQGTRERPEVDWSKVVDLEDQDSEVIVNDIELDVP